MTVLLASSAGPASGATVRTETTLGGYSIKTLAAPFRVFLDDPALAIPHEPGTPVLEVDPSYTAATLESGPNARALASSLWPGSLFGDGIGTVTSGGIASYPIKADARYPDKPYTDDDKAGGAFMHSEALGLDVKARARANPADQPGTLDVASVSSSSTATVKDGVAVGTAESHVTGIKLLAGIISIDSVSTTLKVSGDGKKGTSSGQTLVSGLTVGGVGYAVDDKGVHAVGPTDQGTGALPTDGLSGLQQLGITISGIGQKHTQDATGATRDAAGLRIDVDTFVLRGVLDNIPSQITDALYGIFSRAPEQARGFLFYLLQATPRISFIIGGANGKAAASLPLSFDFPDLPGPGGVILPPSTGGTVTAPLPGSVGGPVVSPVTPAAPGPVVLPPSSSPQLVKAASKDPFDGLPAGLVLLVLALAGLGGWGLVRVQSAAFAGLVGAGPCTDGTTDDLPDLRGA